PNKTPAQEELLRRALRFYEELSAEQGDDLEVRAGAARAAFRVGHIRLALGQPEDAEPILTRAATDLRALHAADPENVAGRRDLTDSLAARGALYKETGRLGPATEVLQQSYDLLDQKVGPTPNRAVDWPLARAAANLGAVYGFQRRMTDAEKVLRRGVTVV